MKKTLGVITDRTMRKRRRVLHEKEELVECEKKILVEREKKIIESEFDVGFYLEQNQDVAHAGVEPIEHFIRFGWREGRDPSATFNVNEYLSNKVDVKESGINPLVHHVLAHDEARRMAKSVKAEQREESDKNIVLHNYEHMNPEMSGLGAEKPSDGEVASDEGVQNDGENDKLTLPLEIEKRLIESEFDTQFYLERNGDVADSDFEPIEHFILFGWREGRDPSSSFNVQKYLSENPGVEEGGVSPLLHYILAKVSGSKTSAKEYDSKTSAKEYERENRWSSINAAIESRFSNGVLAEALERAVEIEPMVALPVKVPGIRHPTDLKPILTECAAVCRKKFANAQYDAILVVPHCRMSGGAKLAGNTGKALCDKYGAERVLVLYTDRDEFEHPEWYPDGAEIFSFHHLAKNLDAQSKFMLLLDIFRGIGPKVIINMNSRLMWDCLRDYGRQLSNEFKIVSYLFCWEENKEGVKIGYPIQWLRYCIDYHDLILTDTEFLAEHIRSRFGLYGDRNRVQAIHTTIEYQPDVITWNPDVVEPAEIDKERKVALWCGRFDRQKRLDVLIEIAKRLPDVDFVLYGKVVLENSLPGKKYIPNNIYLNGEYKKLQHILGTKYDVFVYTSQWDGLPNILLEIAETGIPIIAPDVGGVGELIDNTTGVFVEDYEDVDAYVEGIEQILSNPDEALQRSVNLKNRVANNFCLEKFSKKIGSALNDF